MSDLSIIIVNWNTCDYLAKCLQSLYATSDGIDTAAPGALSFGPYRAEVFVVDNASMDHSPQMVRERFPWVRLIENDENRGFAPANNQAFRESSGGYVMLLNSDTEAHSKAIEILLDFMEIHPTCGAAGARLLNANGNLQPSCRPMLTPQREFWRLIFLDQLVRRATYDMEHWDVCTPRPVETLKGACILLRRTALDEIGQLLDERYFMYTEEIDLCYRLQQARWEVHWVPQAKITHFGEASSNQVADKMYVQLYRSKVQFYRKFGGEARARLFKRLVAVAYLPRLITAQLAALFKPEMASRVRTFRNLLTELSRM